MDGSEARTTTADALLGLLSMCPMSGYQIRLRIEESIGNFWTESFGQIYPTLKRMEAEQLVSSAPSGGAGGRTSRVYTLTARGRERLRVWLGLPARDQVPRNELLLKIFFADVGGAAQAAGQVMEARERYRAEVKLLKGIEKRLTTVYAAHPSMPYWRLTVRYGLAEARSHVLWADEALVVLSGMGKEEGSTRRKHAR